MKLKPSLWAAPALVVLAGASYWDLSAAAACPTNMILGVPSTNPIWAHTDSGTLYSESGSYDLVAGTLSGSLTTYLDGSATLVFASDDYTVTGLPEGTSVTLMVEITGQASVTGIGSYSISTQTSGGASAHQDQGNSWDGTFSVPVSASAGVPFGVQYELHATSGGFLSTTQVNESVTFHFLGLPPGSSIVSCQGYHQDATPTLVATWGGIKARLYR